MGVVARRTPVSFGVGLMPIRMVSSAKRRCQRPCGAGFRKPIPTRTNRSHKRKWLRICAAWRLRGRAGKVKKAQKSRRRIVKNARSQLPVAVVQVHRLPVRGSVQVHRLCAKGNIVVQPSAAVHGVLYRLTASQLDRLAEFEGGYRRASVQVGSKGYRTTAETFVAIAPGCDVGPSVEYLGHYAQGMVEHGISRMYADRILADLDAELVHAFDRAWSRFLSASAPTLQR